MTAARRVTPMLALLAIFIACGETPDRSADSEAVPDTAGVPETAPVPEWVGDVAAIADAIEARPNAVDSILAAHNLTSAVFDSLMYEIAADPALSAAYEEARGG